MKMLSFFKKHLDFTSCFDIGYPCILFSLMLAKECFIFSQGLHHKSLNLLFSPVTLVYHILVHMHIQLT